jgi:hypothetical protein
MKDKNQLFNTTNYFQDKSSRTLKLRYLKDYLKFKTHLRKIQ